MSTWRAHAKLTMSLHVTGVRDDGYHLIDAEMVSLELHDLLAFEPCDAQTEPALTAIGPFAAGVPTDGTNLVARALDLAGSRAVTTIDKRIPHGGGLGGGSTDAATALRWGGFGTSRSELERAGRLGADIPFCLVGGRAHVSGIGELVEPLPHLARTVTLVIPPLHVSTPAVYRAWDDLGQRSDGDATERSGGRGDRRRTRPGALASADSRTHRPRSDPRRQRRHVVRRGIVRARARRPRHARCNRSGDAHGRRRTRHRSRYMTGTGGTERAIEGNYLRRW